VSRRLPARTRAFGAATGATVAALLLLLFTDLPWWVWLLILLAGLVLVTAFAARRTRRI
jgi:uncharacterized membrane protein YgaE (UPF0421/DUF939 family)